MAARALILALLSLAACYSPRDAFVCASADQCQVGGQSGTCESNGYCSYADESCSSGRRYGEAAGGGSAGQCVGDDSGGGDATSDIDAAVLPDVIVITGCEVHEDCAPLTDACGTGACDTATGVCQKIPGADGTVCGEPQCGAFGDCGGFDSTCDTSGTQSRSCKPMTCVTGHCILQGPVNDTQGCSRGTDGQSCGGVVCTDWGACDWQYECSESATQYRTCYPQVCSGGGCGNGAGSTESQGCSRDTDMQPCYIPCSPWVGVCELGNCLCT